MKLLIQPITHEVSSLEEIAWRIMDAQPLLKGFKMLSKLGFYDDYDKDVFVHRSMMYYNRDPLLKFLSRYKRPILALISYETVDNWDDKFVFGANHEDVGFVCNARDEFGSFGSDEWVKKTVSMSLHVLGHMQGLSHHTGMTVYTTNDRLCPMDVSAISGRRDMDWSGYLNALGTRYCWKCDAILSDLVLREHKT